MLSKEMVDMVGLSESVRICSLDNFVAKKKTIKLANVAKMLEWREDINFTEHDLNDFE